MSFLIRNSIRPKQRSYTWGKIENMLDLIQSYPGLNDKDVALNPEGENLF